jgi:tetratricopeptide (TPR) repeat protein
MIERGISLFNEGKYDETMEWILPIIEYLENDPLFTVSYYEALFLRGKFYAVKGDTKQATTDYNSILLFVGEFDSIQALGEIPITDVRAALSEIERVI